MAQAVLLDIEGAIIDNLGEQEHGGRSSSNGLLREIGTGLRVKNELDRIGNALSALQEVLLHAEDQELQQNEVKLVLGNLQQVMYDAEDLLDDFASEVLCREAMTRNKMGKELRVFASSSNQLAYHWRMLPKIRAMKGSLYSIVAEIKGRRQNLSSSPEQVVGNEKATVAAEKTVRKLSSRSVQEIGHWHGVKGELLMLKETLSRARAMLVDAEEEEVEQENQVKVWLRNLKEVAHNADELLRDLLKNAPRGQAIFAEDMWNIGKVHHLNFSPSVRVAYGLKLGQELKAMRERLDVILANAKRAKVVERTRAPQTRSTLNTPEVGNIFVGRGGDKEALINVLKSSTGKNVSVLPIVGVGGVGKTTLARHVYEDSSVKKQFDLRMWASVSSVLNVRAIIERAIKSATNSKLQDLALDQLQNLFLKQIGGKKYLLVLDDFLSEDFTEWPDLEELLMRGAQGSWIIITTRDAVVASITGTAASYHLQGLSSPDSWSLFKHIVSSVSGKETVPEKPDKIGNRILSQCDGVPLAIKTVAGLLCSKNPETEWEPFVENELSKINGQGNDSLRTLLLSYSYLPPHLKRCFAYCKLFPREYEISVQTLIQLWIAQGYIRPKDSSQTLEDIGLEYFKDLSWHDFLTEVEKDRSGTVADQSCKIEGLMYDLATRVAQAETTISRSSSEIVDGKVRHVSFDFHLDTKWKVPDHMQSLKWLRTFLLPKQEFSPTMGEREDPSYKVLFSKFRSLRVFDLHDFGIEEVPLVIKKLKHLRYLDVAKNDELKVLPNFITKLQNLQVLKLSDCEKLEKLPNNIKNLGNLRHLYCEGCWSLTHMPRGIGRLTSLQTLTWFVVARDPHVSKHIGGLGELRHLNSLRGKLEIRNLGYVKRGVAEFEEANFEKKEHLQSLGLYWDREDDDDHSVDVDYEERSLKCLQPHKNLKELKVDGYRGVKFPAWFEVLTNLVDIRIQYCKSCEHLPPINQLSSLKFVVICDLPNLIYMHDDGSVLNARGEGGLIFPSLKELCIYNCPKLKGWWKKEYDGDHELPQFSCLCKLEIQDCPQLTWMPLFPTLDDKLLLENSSLVTLQQTMKMKMKGPLQSTSPPSTSCSSASPLSKLKELWIKMIEDVESIPEEGLLNLTSLEALHVIGCPKLNSLPKELRGLTSLRNLEISECPLLKEKCGSYKGDDWHKICHIPDIQIDEEKIKLKGCYQLHVDPLCKFSSATIEGLDFMTDEWLQNLTSLQQLHIKNCPGLTALPQGIKKLTSLQELHISGCSHLKQRCGNKKGEDWPRIDHIPYIQVDGQWIQLEGSYLFDKNDESPTAITEIIEE